MYFPYSVAEGEGTFTFLQALRQEQLSMREEKRSKLLRNKRVGLKEVETAVQGISTEELLELAVKLRMGRADAACLKEIRKATCSEHKIETFMSVSDVLPALVELLTCKDPDKQVEAAGCIINLTCGSHATTCRIAESIGVYLIVYIQSSSSALQDLCAWAAGNIVNDCQDCFGILKAQGLLPPLVDLLQSTFPEVIQSAVYSLHACTKYQDGLSDLMKLCLPQYIDPVFTSMDLPHDALVDTAFILCNICYQITVQETYEMYITLGNLVLHSLHKIMKEGDIDVSLTTPLVRCLGYLTCGPVALCETLCIHPGLNSCIVRIMQSSYHHLKRELLWPVTNILVSSESFLRCSFDVNLILDNIGLFLSPLDSGVLQALYFLCILLRNKPEMKNNIKNRGLLAPVQKLAFCGNNNLESAARLFCMHVGIIIRGN